ncbi:retrovirus-related pol polyprotein from transposon TNT 1-94 [Tanacetum coccineum]
MSITCVERPWLSEAEGFILPNHDTGRILPAESQRNTTDPSVAVTDSSATIFHTTTDHNDIEWFRRGEALQAKKDEALKSNKAETSNANKSKTPNKSYLHKYEEQPGPKVVFGDDSTCTTKCYGSIKCNGLVFTKVAFINGLKYNLISISQLCDAKYIVQFDEKRGTIFNSNKEVVMIAPRVRDVYVLDMTSSAQESCFFAKSSDNLNWLLHKRLAHLNFKTINKMAKQNLVIGLPSLVYSKDKPCPLTMKSIPLSLLMSTQGTPSLHPLINNDHTRKFNDKANVGISLDTFVSKPSEPSTQRRLSQTKKKTFHLDDFDECPDARNFYPYEPSQRYQVNRNIFSFIEPYERPKLVIIETDGSSDQNDKTDQNDQNDHSAQDDEIVNDDQSEHSNHNNDNHIIDNLPNTKDVQISEPLSFPAEDALILNTIPISTNPSLSIPSMASLAPQDRWSQDKHIKLVNIIGDPGAGMLTRAMAKELSVASAHECLFIDFLSEEEPKKVSEALKHPGWVDAMQEELN